jgi:hypothetical protein
MWTNTVLQLIVKNRKTVGSRENIKHYVLYLLCIITYLTFKYSV